MKVLVTGSSGLLGTYLLVELLKAGSEIYAAYKDNKPLVSHERITPVQMDIAYVDTCLNISRISPDVVIHTAGMTDVDECEKNPLQALLYNFAGTANVAEGARLAGARLIYISTNDIFGYDGPHDELSTPKPINIYARSKLLAEDAVIMRGVDFIIVRTSFFGWCNRPNHSIAHKVVNTLRSNTQIKMAIDQDSTMIYAGDLASILVKFCNVSRRFMSVVHLTSEEALSRYEFGCMLARQFNLDSDLIVPSMYSDIRKDLGLVAERPLKATLATALKYSYGLTTKIAIYKMKMDESVYDI